MLTTDILLLIGGDVADAGEFKASKQHIISSPLHFEDIKNYFDEVISGSEFTYDDEQSMDDIGSYLAIDIEDYITDGNKYLIIIYDNDKRYDHSDELEN